MREPGNVNLLATEANLSKSADVYKDALEKEVDVIYSIEKIWITDSKIFYLWK